jgi:hypothetical protein
MNFYNVIVFVCISIKNKSFWFYSIRTFFLLTSITVLAVDTLNKQKDKKKKNSFFNKLTANLKYLSAYKIHY